MIRGIIMASLAVCFTSSASYAQKSPDWVKNGGNLCQFASGLYMIDFGGIGSASDEHGDHMFGRKQWMK